MNVRFIDTSIMTNILDIPNKNEDRDEVVRELNELMSLRNETLFLPLSTIIETGNHIAHIDDGNLRRKIAEKFSEYLLRTINREAPWDLYGTELTESDIQCIAEHFPDNAMREIGIGDLCIIQHYNTYKDSAPAIGRIMIWCKDKHLAGYVENLEGVVRRRSQ